MAETFKVTGTLHDYPQKGSDHENKHLFYVTVTDEKDVKEIPNVLMRDKTVRKGTGQYAKKEKFETKIAPKCIWFDDLSMFAGVAPGDKVEAEVKLFCVHAPKWDDDKEAVRWGGVSQSYLMLQNAIIKSGAKTGK